MATFDGQVTVGADDGQWFATTFQNNGPTNNPGNAGGAAVNLFFRIQNVDFNGTVNSSYLSLRAGATQTNTVNLRIYAEKAANPSAPTTAADANSRTLTTAFVNWTPANSTLNVYQDTPDISTILQELVDAYTYDGTQSINFFIKDNGSAANQNRQFRSYEHSSTLSPEKVHIDWTSSNNPPTITPDTADAEAFTTLTPTLLFTGEDTESDPLTYEVDISDRSDFPTSGDYVVDSNTDTPVGIVHPNPLPATLTWQGLIQVDDRPGNTFVGNGNGILKSVVVRFGVDLLTDGYARVRVYDIQGTPGTDGAPLNAATAANTPTPNWLAESDQFPFDTGGGAAALRTLTFSGANQIRLEAGKDYIFIIDWIPTTDDYDNTITVSATANTGHPGNAYIDGDSANWGPNLTFDVYFLVYETITTISIASDTDPGFANQVSGLDTDPFTAGDQIGYTLQTALTPGVVYYWRARCNDPSGSGVWSSYTATRTFTVSNGGGGSGAIQTKLNTAIRLGL